MTKPATGPEKSRKGLKATQAKAPASASRHRATRPPPAAVSSETMEAFAIKQAQPIVLLKQAFDAGLADLMSATGWQTHSVRGVISGVLRKRLQLLVICETVEGNDAFSHHSMR